VLACELVHLPYKTAGVFGTSPESNRKKNLEKVSGHNQSLKLTGRAGAAIGRFIFRQHFPGQSGFSVGPFRQLSFSLGITNHSRIFRN